MEKPRKDGYGFGIYGREYLDIIVVRIKKKIG